MVSYEYNCCKTFIFLFPLIILDCLTMFTKISSLFIVLKSKLTKYFILRYSIIYSVVNYVVVFSENYGILYYFVVVFSTYCLIKFFQFNKYLLLISTFIFSTLTGLVFYLEYGLGIIVHAEFLLTMLSHQNAIAKFTFSFKYISVIVVIILWWVYSILPVFYSKAKFKKITQEDISFFKFNRLMISFLPLYIGLKFPTLFTMLTSSYDKPFYPHSTFAYVKYYINNLRPLMQSQNKRFSLESHFSKKDEGKKPITIVLYLGESSRGNNFSINGYEKRTNDLLKGLSLINFGLTRSCSNITIKAATCLLTHYNFIDSTILSNVLEEKSIVETLEKFQFNTGYIGVNDTKPLNWYLSESVKNVVYTSKFLTVVGVFMPKSAIDGDVDLGMQVYMKEHFRKKKDNFILIRNMGSHFPYALAYPKEFEKFSPTCDISDSICKNEFLINSYDNTIHYASYLIRSIIKTLEKTDEDILFIYTSDHGQSLGENNLYYHNNKSLENFTVPLFVWVSDSFKINRKKEYNQLVKNAQKAYNRMDQGSIWYTILDLSGLSNKNPSQYLDYSKSLVRKEFKIPLEDKWRANFSYEKLMEEGSKEL